ncbi:hypothetical protein AB5J62_33810 [Amycolatopsis sp. cg5]|uniref:hypothetical protein n=1 Tax=Amycolatopsis sp. cg5 TaxID=3238802 RepID=UPI003525FE3C
MRARELRQGERIIPAADLARWGVDIPDGWTVTIRPDGIDSSARPIDFPVGHYTAHDHDAFLHKRLVFLEVMADAYNKDGRKVGSDEIVGVEWRPPLTPPPRRVIPGEANVDELLTEDERKRLAENAVAHGIQAWGRK